MARPSMFSNAPATGSDRLASMQESDQRQQMLDQQQQQNFMEQLKTLYGMGQSSQLMPANIAHLGAETGYLGAQTQHLGQEDQQTAAMQPFMQARMGADTAHLTYEDSRAQAMFPATLAHTNADTAHLTSEDTRSQALLPYQQKALQATTEGTNATTEHTLDDEARAKAMYPNLESKSIAETARDNALTASVGPKSLAHIQGMAQLEQMGVFPHGFTEQYARMTNPEMGAWIDQQKNQQSQAKWAQYENMAKTGGFPSQMDPQATNEFGTGNVAYLHSLGMQTQPSGMHFTAEQMQRPDVQSKLGEYQVTHQVQENPELAKQLDQLDTLNHPWAAPIRHLLNGNDQDVLNFLSIPKGPATPSTPLPAPPPASDPDFLSSLLLKMFPKKQPTQ